MDNLVIKQTVLHSQLERAYSNYKKDSKARKTSNYLKKVLERIEAVNNSFQSNHESIMDSLTGAESEMNSDYFTECRNSVFEELYIQFYVEVKDLLEEAQSSIEIPKSRIETESRIGELKLPIITLPTFSGGYEAWVSFRDLYKSLIHDKTTLDNVEKFHYLKSSLSGEAANLLKQLPLTGSNYEVAWSLLEDRYDNKGALLNAQFKTLFEIGSANESASSLKTLLDKTVESVQSLANSGIQDIWQSVIVYITTQRLPMETRQLWEQQQATNGTLPTFDELKVFLQKRFRALEASGVTHVKASCQKKFSSTSFRNINSHIAEVKESCVLCKQEHPIRTCSRFLALQHFDRLNFVKRNGLCINCLRKGHLMANCSSTSRCLKCKKSHHSLLHKEVINTTSSTSVEANQQPGCSKNVNALNATADQEVLLATAVVTVEAPNGRIMVRALLDQGSQASFISEAAVQLLGLKRKMINVNVSGIGSSSTAPVRGYVDTQLLVGDNESIHFGALILETITNLLPSRDIAHSILDQLENVQLADPHFYKTGKIDLLLGADMYAQLILNGTLRLTAGPILQKTRLGWILSGSIHTKDFRKTYHSFKVEVSENISISDQLRKFWELEELQPERLMTAEEEYCERHYKDNTVRDENGRYTVRLPFKNERAIDTLGYSEFQAIASFKSLEKRFEKNPRLKEEYQQCLNEYIDSNHMERIGVSKQIKKESKNHYLPHHAVFKESTTTKLRIVFDASRKTSSGVSLNDILLTGPTIQNTMVSVIMRWRLFRFAFIADIARMYRQINVHEDDTDLQRIVWKSKDTLDHYRLTTVTFGTTCAPFLAIRTLHQLAADEKENFPKAFDMVHDEFYVDDLLSGGRNFEEVSTKMKQITSMLKSGGFMLRKWIANDPKLLEGIPDEEIEMKNYLEMDMDQGYKSLGIYWHPLNDHFRYKLKLPEMKAPYTKRQLLSEIAQLFDPLGWLAPIIINAKILLQILWRHGDTWDEPIPVIIENIWLEFREDLRIIENIKVPRHILEPGASTLEIHGFSDASKEAYAAAVYLVSRSELSTSVHLVMAKTKVAPIRTVSIPRLELCGAVLLAKLVREVKDSLHLQNVSTYLWSDSKIVLAWIKGQPKRWSVFVANRTTEIFNVVGNTSWRHVPSKQNPADLASRGIEPGDLVDNTFWWNGPHWLSKDQAYWPNMTETVVTDEEERKDVLVHHTIRMINNFEILLEKCSTFDRLLRITAYCYRFIDIVSKKTNDKGYLKIAELERAKKFWISYVQHKEFSEDLDNLRNEKELSKSSKILKLRPTLDGKGILRVGGRLENSDLAFSEKHPIIIPKTGKFTELLVRHIHYITLHGGTQLMLATLRCKYWLIDARSVIQQFNHRCIPCFRTKAKGSSQLMGDLPRPRVTISRPFTHTGVDYCGPVRIKDKNGRGSKNHKGYIAIFICLAVKAIHIELVNDLSTNSFLAALKRFIGRRGICQHIYSDCGTNFVGADAELRRITSRNPEIAASINNLGITWHFNPPASPHFGGLWEAGVKSVKLHLRRVLRDVTLTYEEFSTTLVQIEACLNSRPLSPLSDDPMDTNAITPAHFLIGDNLIMPPEDDVTELRLNHLDRWQFCQRLAQTFWKRWSTEYLSRLQQRPKWITKEIQPKIGDLCLLKDENMHSCKWPLGRITEIHPGKDGLVRVVTVFTKGNHFKRAITKIALVPVQ